MGAFILVELSASSCEALRHMLRHDNKERVPHTCVAGQPFKAMQVHPRMSETQTHGTHTHIHTHARAHTPITPQHGSLVRSAATRAATRAAACSHATPPDPHLLAWLCSLWRRSRSRYFMLVCWWVQVQQWVQVAVCPCSAQRMHAAVHHGGDAGHSCRDS